MDEIRIRVCYKTIEELRECKGFDVEYCRVNNIKTTHVKYCQENQEYVVIMHKYEY